MTPGSREGVTKTGQPVVVLRTETTSTRVLLLLSLSSVSFGASYYTTSVHVCIRDTHVDHENIYMSIQYRNRFRSFVGKK